MTERPNESDRIGPNVKRLIAMKMAREAVPDGGGFNDAVQFLSSPEKLKSGVVAAAESVKFMISLVRSAAEPNPWKDASAEEIAGHILGEIENRKKGTLS